MSGAGAGLAGMNNGSFFTAPSWVALEKKPGHTKQGATPWVTLLSNFIKLKHIIYSPNLIWLSITVAVYVVFPYDLVSARQGFKADWILTRSAINLGVTFAYYGFWDVALYLVQWSKRKFRPECWPSTPRMLHNLWYCTLGVGVYTLFEVMFMRAYASGALPYMRDQDILASPANLLRFVGWSAVIPMWRGTHFYFAHRFIHIRFMYKYVHSLHHRNIDIEPFAGLTMHPVEHLYYFSCILPSLYFYMSPFHLLFNGMHLLLSPAASHSGWEDHVQSDQFHYVHHARFWCNYGSASMPLDNLFGTFKTELSSRTDTTDTQQAAGSPSSPYVTKIPQQFYTYMAFTAMVFAAWLAALGDMPVLGANLAEWPRTLAAFVAYSPVVFALWLTLATGDKLPVRWPFAHEDVLGKFGLHAVLGFLTGVLPVYHTITSGLGASPYCQLHTCPEVLPA